MRALVVALRTTVAPRRVVQRDLAVVGLTVAVAAKNFRLMRRGEIRRRRSRRGSQVPLRRSRRATPAPLECRLGGAGRIRRRLPVVAPAMVMGRAVVASGAAAAAVTSSAVVVLAAPAATIAAADGSRRLLICCRRRRVYCRRLSPLWATLRVEGVLPLLPLPTPAAQMAWLRWLRRPSPRS